MQVQEVIGQNRAELLERRYTFPVGKLMGEMREKLKWADGKLVKEIIEKQVAMCSVILKLVYSHNFSL